MRPAAPATATLITRAAPPAPGRGAQGSAPSGSIAARKRLLVGPDAGDRQPLGVEQLAGERRAPASIVDRVDPLDHLVDGEDRHAR